MNDFQEKNICIDTYRWVYIWGWYLWVSLKVHHILKNVCVWMSQNRVGKKEHGEWSSQWQNMCIRLCNDVLAWIVHITNKYRVRLSVCLRGTLSCDGKNYFDLLHCYALRRKLFDQKYKIFLSFWICRHVEIGGKINALFIE